MRKFLAIAFFVLAITVVITPHSSAADNSMGVIGWAGIGGAGCSAANYDTPCSDKPADGLFSSIACRVMKTFNAAIIPIYCNIVSNPEYLRTVDAAMMLYVILLGFAFISGMVPMRTGPFMGKLLKATFIYALVSNADLYFNIVYGVAIQIPQEVVKVMLEANTGSGSGTGSQNFFEYVDQGISKLFNEVFYPEVTEQSGTTYQKADLKMFVMVLAVWQVGGDMVGGLFFGVMIGWLVAYFSIMIRYLLALLSMMFLLMLGPLFIPTLLFDKSKFLGDEWIKMIISLIIQIVVVVAFIILVQGFFIDFYDMLKDGLNKVAPKESTAKYLAPYGQDTYKLEQSLGTNNPESAKQYTDQVLGGDTYQELPKMTFNLLVALVVVYMAYTFMQTIPSFAVLLSGNPRFVRLFNGGSFSGKANSELQAPLLGQKQTYTGKEDVIGKMFESMFQR